MGDRMPTHRPFLQLREYAQPRWRRWRTSVFSGSLWIISARAAGRRASGASLQSSDNAHARQRRASRRCTDGRWPTLHASTPPVPRRGTPPIPGPATGWAACAARARLIPANGGAQPLAVVQQQLGHLFVTAVRSPLAVAEQDVGPRRDARDLFANDLPHTRCLAELIDQVQDVILRSGVVTARTWTQALRSVARSQVPLRASSDPRRSAGWSCRPVGARSRMRRAMRSSATKQRRPRRSRNVRENLRLPLPPVIIQGVFALTHATHVRFINRRARRRHFLRSQRGA